MGFSFGNVRYEATKPEEDVKAALAEDRMKTIGAGRVFQLGWRERIKVLLSGRLMTHVQLDLLSDEYPDKLRERWTIWFP